MSPQSRPEVIGRVVKAQNQWHDGRTSVNGHSDLVQLALELSAWRKGRAQDVIQQEPSHTSHAIISTYNEVQRPLPSARNGHDSHLDRSEGAHRANVLDHADPDHRFSTIEHNGSGAFDYQVSMFPNILEESSNSTKSRVSQARHHFELTDQYRQLIGWLDHGRDASCMVKLGLNGSNTYAGFNRLQVIRNRQNERLNESWSTRSSRGTQYSTKEHSFPSTHTRTSKRTAKDTICDDATASPSSCGSTIRSSLHGAGDVPHKIPIAWYVSPSELICDLYQAVVGVSDVPTEENARLSFDSFLRQVRDITRAAKPEENLPQLATRSNDDTCTDRISRPSILELRTPLRGDAHLRTMQQVTHSNQLPRMEPESIGPLLNDHSRHEQPQVHTTDPLKLSDLLEGHPHMALRDKTTCTTPAEMTVVRPSTEERVIQSLINDAHDVDKDRAQALCANVASCGNLQQEEDSVRYSDAHLPTTPVLSSSFLEYRHRNHQDLSEINVGPDGTEPAVAIRAPVSLTLQTPRNESPELRHGKDLVPKRESNGLPVDTNKVENIPDVYSRGSDHGLMATDPLIEASECPNFVNARHISRHQVDLSHLESLSPMSRAIHNSPFPHTDDVRHGHAAPLLLDRVSGPKTVQARFDDINASITPMVLTGNQKMMRNKFFSEQANVHINTTGLHVRNTARIKAMVLSSGIKARSITSRFSLSSPLPDRATNVVLQSVDCGQTACELDIYCTHGSQMMCAKLDVDLHGLELAIQKFATDIVESHHVGLSSIRSRVPARGATKVHDTSTRADSLFMHLMTKTPQAVRHINEAIDDMTRIRRRRFVRLRRTAFKLLEWGVLGIMWCIWLSVVILNSCKHVFALISRTLLWLLSF